RYSARETIMLNKTRLRTKLLFSIISISCLLACSTVLVVRRRMEQKVRADLAEAVHNSLVTFQNFQRQRESTLARSAQLLADLPTLRALMTTDDPATIQDGSAELWRMTGSDLFVLADRAGKLAALDTKTNGFTPAAAQASLRRALAAGESRDWWYGNGHLYRVFLQPIYFGSPSEGVLLGVLGIGYEIGPGVAREIRQVASSEVAFLYGGHLVVSTLPADQQTRLLLATDRERGAGNSGAYGKVRDFKLGSERFVGVSVKLPPPGEAAVSLTVLKSYDKATMFLLSLNRRLFGIGLAAVFAGIGLAFLISHTVTRPLDNLVSGVRALEKGDFNYPLLSTRQDEVGELTGAFNRMRESLQATQNELLHAERLATMGSMASAISHDLRHPLTAILAYSEFLSEGRLSESQRSDFYGEIRQAVNRMSDLIDSLLEFSKSRQSIRPQYCNLEDSVRRAIQAVQARPEFRRLGISVWHEGKCDGWFDPVKLDRVFHNLLLNACEAVPHESGLIEVRIRQLAGGIDIRIADNGPGIPEPIRDSVFHPFVSYGKENGTGLGLAVVQKMVEDHGGAISIEHTGHDGTIFRVTLPQNSPPALPAEV
ncbi:MAG: ATP-binding protein, partial [Terriglobia bacterium]